VRAVGEVPWYGKRAAPHAPLGHGIAASVRENQANQAAFLAGRAGREAEGKGARRPPRPEKQRVNWARRGTGGDGFSSEGSLAMAGLSGSHPAM
jgi:hypothetical protein